MSEKVQTNHEHPVVVSAPQEPPANLRQPVIDVRSFSFYYGDFKALDSVTLPIPVRRITALIGASGCGKSTLLRAMNRMHDNTIGAQGEGDIIFDGENILTNKNLIKLRKEIGMIFQRSTVFPMSIRENILYGLHLASQRVPTREAERRLEQVLRDAA